MVCDRFPWRIGRRQCPGFGRAVVGFGRFVRFVRFVVPGSRIGRERRVVVFGRRIVERTGCLRWRLRLPLIRIRR